MAWPQELTCSLLLPHRCHPQQLSTPFKALPGTSIVDVLLTPPPSSPSVEEVTSSSSSTTVDLKVVWVCKPGDELLLLLLGSLSSITSACLSVTVEDEDGEREKDEDVDCSDSNEAASGSWFNEIFTNDDT
jgi:hypothetical protein